MALSRKRKREIAKLKGRASDVWDDQKDVLDRANRVIREASKHAGVYAREEVAPRAREAFDARVKPMVAAGASAGFSAARGAASVGRERFNDDVLPAVTSAVGSAMALLEVAKDPRVREAIKQARSTTSAVAARTGIVQKKSPGVGRYILIGVGIVALAGVAYAAWQTLRADDDLWIDDEDASEPPSEIQAS